MQTEMNSKEKQVNMINLTLRDQTCMNDILESEQ